MRIVCTVILKDDSEYELAERMLESFMPYFQGLAVALTGLSGKHEKLIKLIESYKGRYVVTTPETHPDIYAKDKDGKWFFANFAAARNASFALADEFKDIDWYTWADVDDVLHGGKEIKKVAKMAKEQKLDAVMFTYWYQVVQDKKGNIQQVAITHTRERLIKPKKFKWISRLHEVAVPIDGNYKPRLSEYDLDAKKGQQCVWVHLPPEAHIDQNMHRNVQILEYQVKEEERKDPRTLFYLAKCYFDLGNQEPKKASLHLQACEDLLKDYLKKSGWAEERSTAWEYMGDIAAKRGDSQLAIKKYHRAIAEHGIGHMKYLKLVREYYNLNHEELANHWFDIVMKMPKPKARSVMGNPYEVLLTTTAIKYNVAMHKGDFKTAYKWIKKRNQILEEPDEEKEKETKELLEMQKSANRIYRYARWLKDQGHKKELKHLLSTIPDEFKDEQFVQHIANEVIDPVKWPKKSIVYFCGNSFDAWNGQKVRDGIGGSETAATMLSEAWVKQGYKVTVFCNCLKEGEYKGVDYKHFTKINWNDRFDTIILWRNPALLDLDMKANKIMVDLHDVASQMDWSQERMDKADAVMVKSEYHRKMLPKMPDNKIHIISNGI